MSIHSGQSYDVRIWATRRYPGKRGTTYNVRWRVGFKSQGRTFGTTKAAESFRAELLTAHRKGEPFLVESGLPPSMRPTANTVTWFEHACAFVDLKWAHASARHRKGLAEALTSVTCAMWTSDRGSPSPKEQRRALQAWAFNRSARRQPLAQADVPDDFVDQVTWMRKRSIPVGELSDPTVLRRALDACATKLDGSPAAGSTTARKRSALYSALELAVELEHLSTNPMNKVRQPRRNRAEEVDRRVVVNPTQARALIEEVGRIHPSLEAFVACLYFAGLRPAEARHLRVKDLRVPAQGWGQLTLAGSTQAAGQAWTDAGTADEDRALKHRAAKEVRQVPAHPDLVEILQRHIEAFESSPDGRLFVSRFGIAGRPLPRPFSKPLPMGTVYRVWKQAREAVFDADDAASPLARRPYDLRHACVSTWLNAGVPATQVAAWAGHSVNVLLRVYAKCVYGQEEQALQRIDGALGGRS